MSFLVHTPLSDEAGMVQVWGFDSSRGFLAWMGLKIGLENVDPREAGRIVPTLLVASSGR